MDLVQPDNPGTSTPLYISPQIEDLLGYPYAAWLTEDELWLDVLHPDDRERMVAADANARRTLSSLFAEYRMVHRDGHVIWVSEKAAVVQGDGDAMYWQGVMVDITDRKLVESALATSERQFRSIFDAAAIGVMTVGLDGLILEANATLEEICDYPAGALQGQLLFDYLEAADRTSIERFDELVAGVSDRCHLEHLFRRNNRSLMWCRTVMALVRDDEGHPVHITAMLEDISDRKLVEADLVHRTLHDPLTELPNRQYFLDRLRQTRARRFVGATAWPSCSWTSTASRRSTTRRATRPATSCCWRWPGACARRSGLRTRSPGSEATSSSCSRAKWSRRPTRSSSRGG